VLTVPTRGSVLELEMVQHKVCVPLIPVGKTFRFLAMYKYLLEAADQTKSSRFKETSSFDRQDRILTSLYDFLVIIMSFLFILHFYLFSIPKLLVLLLLASGAALCFLTQFTFFISEKCKLHQLKCSSFATDAR